MDNLLLRDDAGEWKSELLRVREQIHYQNMQIQHVNKELEQATHEGDNKKTEELRIYRTVLAREREHLRDQETLFLKAIYSDISTPNESITCCNNDFSFGNGGMMVQLPREPLSVTKAPPKASRKRKSMPLDLSALPGTLSVSLSSEAASPDLLGSLDDSFVRRMGVYVLNRNPECKISDIWREWKHGVGQGPAVEKLEELRRRDKKQIWWKSKNDYKFWSKQMRLVRAVNEKAAEYGGSVDAAITYWEEILRVEFEGSISKLREALGGEKMSAENREHGLIGESSSSKQHRRALLQHGIDRLQGWHPMAPRMSLNSSM